MDSEKWSQYCEKSETEVITKSLWQWVTIFPVHVTYLPISTRQKSGISQMKQHKNTKNKIKINIFIFYE